MNGIIAQGVQDVVGESIQSWLADHPTLAWIIAHPLWTIALIVLTLFLCWGLLGAIAQLMQQAWLALLRAPLTLAQFLSRRLFQVFHRQAIPSSTQPEGQQDLQDQLPNLMKRLETLQQEQEALIKAMQAILISKPSSVD